MVTTLHSSLQSVREQYRGLHHDCAWLLLVTQLAALFLSLSLAPRPGRSAPHSLSLTFPLYHFPLHQRLFSRSQTAQRRFTFWQTRIKHFSLSFVSSAMALRWWLGPSDRPGVVPSCSSTHSLFPWLDRPHFALHPGLPSESFLFNKCTL